MSRSLALSTFWRQQRFDSLKAFFEAAENAGFTAFELDAAVSLSDIRDISLPEGQIPSLHLPCPTHPQTFDARFGSLDRYEREAAREAARNAIELAVDLKTDVLLVDLGGIDISPLLENTLRETFAAGGPAAEDFADLQQELGQTRSRNAPPHLKAVLHDVEFLATAADNANLKLGLLPPRRYSDLALPEEMHLILSEFGPPVYYWHSTGRTQVLANLGLVPHETWYETCGPHLLGAHLHDVQGLQALLPPQDKGEVDFAALLPHLTETTYLTCVFGPQHTPEDINQGRQTLLTRLNLLPDDANTKNPT